MYTWASSLDNAASILVTQTSGNGRHLCDTRAFVIRPAADTDAVAPVTGGGGDDLAIATSNGHARVDGAPCSARADAQRIAARPPNPHFTRSRARNAQTDGHVLPAQVN